MLELAIKEATITNKNFIKNDINFNVILMGRELQLLFRYNFDKLEMCFVFFIATISNLQRKRIENEIPFLIT